MAVANFHMKNVECRILMKMKMKKKKKKKTTTFLVQHILETGYKINVNIMVVVANIQHTPKRIKREPIETKKRPFSVNKSKMSIQAYQLHGNI